MMRMIKWTGWLVLAILLAGTSLMSPAVTRADEGGTEFYGTVQYIPAGRLGTWTISNRPVVVNAGTEINEEHGTIMVGAYVKVDGIPQADGTYLARQIEVTDSPGGETPTPGTEDDIYGTVQVMPPGRIGNWTVAGHTVQVTNSTVIDEHEGTAQVGAYVEVRGQHQPDGSTLATRVEVKSGDRHENDSNFYGTVQSIPGGRIGMWVIGGRNVQVTASTNVHNEHGTIQVGDYVEVKGYAQSDGSFLAYEIDRQGGGDGNTGTDRHFYGTIDNLPPNRIGTWTVGGQNVQVTLSTLVSEEHGAAVAGAYVEVTGYAQTDGSTLATKIEVKSSGIGGGEGSNQLFFGTVEAMPAGRIGTWTVSGRTVQVTGGTTIDEHEGNVHVGSFVEVEGTAQADGSVLATLIEVEVTGGTVDHLFGLVESLPTVSQGMATSAISPDGLVGRWVISGQNVEVTNGTEIDQNRGAVSIGAYVEAKGYTQANGTWVATKIEVKIPAGGTVTPSPSPSPTPGTPTPSPTPIPGTTGSTAWVEPAQQSVSLSGGMFTVDVDVRDVTNVGGFEMVLKFDPAILQVDPTNTVLSNFLASNGRSISPLGPIVDNAAGTVRIGGFSFGSQAGASGSGTLATIAFVPQTAGVSPLSFQLFSLVDTLGADIPAAAQPGSINVTNGLAGDLDGNCSVDIVDIMQVAGRWGAQTGDVEFDEQDDLDSNGQIDIVDIMQVAGHWGDTCGTGAAMSASSMMAAPAGPVSLQLSPAAAVAAGEQVAVPVDLSGAQNLGGLEFAMHFDPDVVRFERLALGDWAASTGNTCRPLSAVDNAAGSARVGLFCVGGAAGPDGAGTVANLVFTVVGHGQAALRVDAAKVTDTAGRVQEMGSVEGATLFVNAAPAKLSPRMPAMAPDSLGK